MIKKLERTNADKKKIDSITIDPSILEDDFYDYSKVVIKKPWGKEYLIFKNDNAAVWVLHVNKGQKTSMHCHPNKKSSLVVLSGEVKFRTLDSEYQLFCGQGFWIDKGVFHSTEALEPDEVIVMEVETPINKRDLVRLEDQYGREGRGYEGKDHHLYFNSSLPHFHNDHDKYHRVKRFGNCDLVIFRCEKDMGFRDFISRFNTDIAVILGGRFINSQGEYIMNVGDTIPFRAFGEMKELFMTRDVELLLIKKV